MSDPDRVSLHSSRSSIVANQAALSMAAPANTSKLNNSAIDPAAILLQQQLASGAPTGGAPPGGYTGGALGAPAGGAESGALAPVPAQPRPPEFQLFKEAEHNNELLAGLNDLRQENFLCDVTLMADDKPFQAHRAVLAATSPYLKTLFSDMSGGKIEHEVVEIRGVSAEGLKHIINYIYTSELRLNMTNIREVLAAAGHMQLKAATNFAVSFLKHEISVFNCVDVIQISEQFELPEVEEKAYSFIAQHLNELVKTEEIQKLSIENMSFLLDSNGLKNVSELELFEATRQWLMFDHGRYQYIRPLMEKIRFPQIPPRDLLRYVNFVDFMRIECNYLLLEASNYHMLPHSQPILQSVRTQVRSNDFRMVVVGGVDQQDRVSNQLLALTGDVAKSDFLPPMHEGLCSHCVAVLNNFLYVLGGQNLFDERGNTAVNTVVRYDPRFNIWMRIASMNDKRAGFTVSVVDNRLYALGGVNAAGRLSSMECYSLEDDRWRYVASVQTGLCDHAESVHGNLLYVSGGFKEGRFSNQLLAYSPRHDTWHERAPMNVPRGWHTMVAFGESIFVTGGNAGLNKRVDIHETEIYSIMSNQWTMVAPLPLPQSEGGVCYHNNKIVIIGGYSWTHQKCVNTIQAYDPTKDTWERPGNLPIELSGVKAAVLSIPYSLSSGGKKPSAGMSWPPRSSRSLNQGGAQGAGANSLPLGAINDPMSMGALRDSLNTMSRGTTGTLGPMSSNARGYAPSDAGSLAPSVSGGRGGQSGFGMDSHSRSQSTVGATDDEGPRGTFRGAPGFGSGSGERGYNQQF